jgi:hypothetical protein
MKTRRATGKRSSSTLSNRMLSSDSAESENPSQTTIFYHQQFAITGTSFLPLNLKEETSPRRNSSCLDTPNAALWNSLHVCGANTTALRPPLYTSAFTADLEPTPIDFLIQPKGSFRCTTQQKGGGELSLNGGLSTAEISTTTMNSYILGESAEGKKAFLNLVQPKQLQSNVASTTHPLPFQQSMSVSHRSGKNQSHINSRFINNGLFPLAQLARNNNQEQNATTTAGGERATTNDFLSQPIGDDVF